MKKAIGILALAVLAFVAAVGYTFLPLRLDTSPPAELALPEANPPAVMRLSVLHTGVMRAKEIFAYRGGSPFEPYVSGMAAILVQHPEGDVMIDAGFGRDVDAHFRTTPALMQTLADYEKATPAREQLAGNGYDLSRLEGILLTHAHWDHVSGLPDFGDMPVWVTREERGFIESDDPAAALAGSFDGIDYRILEFGDGPYLGFPDSRDIHGDGSVVAVPVPGHTPGHVAVFVTLPSGTRYVFVGDLVWMREGLTRPAERPLIARMLVDHDPAEVRDGIRRINALMRAHPELVAVPAHDQRVLTEIPAYPDAAR